MHSSKFISLKQYRQVLRLENCAGLVFIQLQEYANVIVFLISGLGSYFLGSEKKSKITIHIGTIVYYIKVYGLFLILCMSTIHLIYALGPKKGTTNYIV